MAFTGVAAAAAVAGGAMAASSASKAKKAADQGTTTTQTPWAEQQPYLTSGFQNAQDIYNTKKDSPYYQGNLYTGMNQAQIDGLAALTNWSAGTGTNLANSAGNAALSGMGNAATYGTNAANFANGNYGNVPGSQAGALSAFGSQALGNYGNVASGLNGVLAAASADPTQRNIDAARQYADNGYINDQIAAASADVTKQLGTDLVGLNNQASAGGNLNSSRAGAAEAELRGQAGRTIGNLSAQMRSSAYTNGLGLAENARTANLGTQLGALGQQGSLVGMGLNASNAAEAARQSEISNRLNANSQLGQSAQLGYQGAALANDLGTANANGMYQAGAAFQNDANNQNAANFQQWQGEDSRAQNLLNNYWNIVAGSNWGGTSNQKTPYAGPSPLSAGLQSGIGTFSSFMGMCWVARAVYGVDSPKWMEFRAWMLTKAPRWFYRLYEKHGERFAAFISDKPRIKAAVRFLFDKILENVKNG